MRTMALQVALGCKARESQKDAPTLEAVMAEFNELKKDEDFNAWVARSNNREPISEFEKQETIMQVKLLLKSSIVNSIDDERREKARFEGHR